MDSVGITKTILSITDPGTHLQAGKDEQARKLSRECNQFASDLQEKRPDRFGFWAALPLPDVEGSLAEIAYALDVLHAAGVCMLTNHHGVYLGDACLEPIFEELDHRAATVFIHPTLPCTHHGAQSQIKFDVPTRQSMTAVMEFFFDGARAIVDLLLSGTIVRYPKIKFIVSHGGGVLPPLIERVIQFSRILSLGGEAMSSESVKSILRRQFFYDLSGFVFPDQIHGLLRLVDKSQLLYGSDYPYTPTGVAVQLAETMDRHLEDVLGDAESVQMVYHGNAQKLLERNTGLDSLKMDA